ncbi:MAG: SDR family oxidoreductase [Elusimicrobia bacterium]|nr:SDR family oxidoreductase [Elusimicrobiota bacterium]
MTRKARRAVVTGGAGFIGSHLVERLLAEGARVVVVDNFATGRMQNLAHLRDDKRLAIHKLDIAETGRLTPLCREADWIFHLAALADIVPSIERPTDYFRANVAGTESVLEAARSAKVSRFVYAASSSCYGIPEACPTPETADIKPEYPYALTKYLGELLVRHWGKVYGLPITSLRFFNVFGPRARTSGTYGAVFGVFLAQKLKGRPCTVVGDGNQTRDFTYVTDVAEALLQAARSPKAEGEVFNVGSGSTYSINRLIRLLDVESVHIPKRPAEPDCTFADISKIRKVLGWQPKVRFEDGVRRMLEHLQDWEDAPIWTPASIKRATQGWFKHLSSGSPR